MRQAVAPLALFLALALLALAPPPAGGVAITVTLEGPDGVAPGGQAFYTVRVAGMEGLPNVTYRIEYWVEAANAAGASPPKDTPFTTTSFLNATRFNVTAPTAEGSMEVHVRVTASGPEGNGTATVAKAVVVARPWTITVPIENRGAVEARDVLVAFYLDGRWIGNTTVDRIPAATGSSPGRANATLTWVPVNVAPGAHELRVTFDLNGDGTIEPALGEVVVTQAVYRTSEGPNAPLALLVIVLTSASFAALLFYLRRRRRRR